jgi:hypothetical protein
MDGQRVADAAGSVRSAPNRQVTAAAGTSRSALHPGAGTARAGVRSAVRAVHDAEAVASPGRAAESPCRASQVPRGVAAAASPPRFCLISGASPGHSGASGSNYPLKRRTEPEIHNIGKHPITRPNRKNIAPSARCLNRTGIERTRRHTGEPMTQLFITAAVAATAGILVGFVAGAGLMAVRLARTPALPPEEPLLLSLVLGIREQAAFV